MANESLQVVKEVVKEVVAKDRIAVSAGAATTAGGWYSLDNISVILGVAGMVTGVVLTLLLAYKAYIDIMLKKKQLEKMEAGNEDH
jgi:hypothetical protein